MSKVASSPIRRHHSLSHLHPVLEDYDHGDHKHHKGDHDRPDDDNQAAAFLSLDHLNDELCANKFHGDEAV